jgi:universal stress protein E
MRQLKSILLPTDFRLASIVASQVAGQMARVFGSRVTALHAVDPGPCLFDALPHFLQNGQMLFRRFREELAVSGLAVCEASVSVGPAAERILAKAEEIDADLIVIGAGEPTYGERFAIGPVAEAVVQHARQPVLAVRPGQPSSAIRRILCPVDCSSVSRRALKNAIRLARAFRGRLSVATVIPELIHVAAVEGTVGLLAAPHQEAWRSHFEDFLAEFDFADVEYTRDARQGVPHRQIVAAAKEHDSDLIVMGATGTSGFQRLLMGSVTRRVLQDLPCSILTVHDEDLLL